MISYIYTNAWLVAGILFFYYKLEKALKSYNTCSELTDVDKRCITMINDFPLQKMPYEVKELMIDFVKDKTNIKEELLYYHRLYKRLIAVIIFAGIIYNIVFLLQT